MEPEACPHCGQEIPSDEWDKHDEGRDAKRLDCPHQDLDLIKEDSEPVRYSPGVLPDRW